ncbi:MAG TPA: tetratricopeptide repeat protein [Pyrinomonadaceae bacterium]|nr:tetratricopeptide repeat protein [Pyrinomonadaceae bacterium]
MKLKTSFALIAASFLLCAASVSFAQSGATRPRRVAPAQPQPSPTAAPRAGQSSATPTTTAPGTARTTPPSNSTSSTGTPAASSAPPGTTLHAKALYDQKQYDAALREAKEIAAGDAKNSDAWMIAGRAELALKQYAEAAEDLQRAVELQRAAGKEDAYTQDALIEAYVRTEKFDRALPLLVAATARKGATPDATLLSYRGLAEFNTNKPADAERSFKAAIVADPKHTVSHYYLGIIAFNRNDDTAAINSFNRATTADPRLAQAWKYLTYAYMRRAAAAAGAKADADSLSAVRASESFLKLRNDDEAISLHGQALIRARQYARAAATLERVAGDNADGTTLYLLGFAHSRAKNFPKAIATLERAAAKSPENVEIFRELGYDYESSKQYAKALAAYEKGLQLAATDAELKESAERVRPFAK